MMLLALLTTQLPVAVVLVVLNRHIIYTRTCVARHHRPLRAGQQAMDCRLLLHLLHTAGAKETACMCAAEHG